MDIPAAFAAHATTADVYAMLDLRSDMVEGLGAVGCETTEEAMLQLACVLVMHRQGRRLA